MRVRGRTASAPVYTGRGNTATQKGAIMAPLPNPQVPPITPTAGTLDRKRSPHPEFVFDDGQREPDRPHHRLTLG